MEDSDPFNTLSLTTVQPRPILRFIYSVFWQFAGISQFPGYVVTKKWAAEHPRTLAAFYRALEQGQRIADVSRAAAEQAMVDMPAPFGVSAETAAVMALDSYPVSTGPVGSVDKIRLQRVVDVMRQFLGFGKFDIGSMLIGSASRPAADSAGGRSTAARMPASPPGDPVAGPVTYPG